MAEPQYAGFWRRLGAFAVDVLLLTVLLLPLLILLAKLAPAPQAEVVTSANAAPLWLVLLVEDLLPLAIFVFFWVRYGATPGKMLLECRIIDARTGANPTLLRAILRYFAYLLSALPLGLGFFWIGWDRRKQGFHDKIAGTLVVRVGDHDPQPDDESRKSLDQLVKEAR